MTKLFLTLILIPLPAAARMGASWGANIVVADSDTGAIVREIYEPCMLEGYTGTAAFIKFQWDSSRKNLRLSWQDVGFSSSGYKGTQMDFTGAPTKRLDRELQFSIPSFSTVPTSNSDTWSDAAAEPISSLDVDGISTVTQKGERPPNVAIKFNDFDTLAWTKDHLFVWNGYELDAYNLPGEKKIWSVDFNPMNDPLPGGSPRAAIFDRGEKILVVTDRLGIRKIRKDTGALIWFLPYGNADAIPEIVLSGARTVVAPAERPHEGLDCMQLTTRNISPNNALERTR
jgi:hypothetical protein